MVRQMKARRKRLEQRIQKLKEELVELQGICKHFALEGKYTGSSGHYSPDDNSYWVEVYCPDCGFRKNYDENEAGYHGAFRRLKYGEEFTKD